MRRNSTFLSSLMAFKNKLSLLRAPLWYYFEKMSSVWHNVISHGSEKLDVLFRVIVDTWANPVPHPRPRCPRSWKWFNFSLWGERQNFWLLNFPDNLWIIAVIVKAVVRNRSPESLSWGLVLMDVEAPKGWCRQGLSKHVLGHRFWKLSTTVPPAELHFRIHSCH